MSTSEASLLEQLLGPNRQDRLAAVESLAALPPDRAVACLTKGTSHWDRALRYRCLEKLCAIQGEAALPRLRSMVESRRAPLGRGATLAVGLRHSDFVRRVEIEATGEHPGRFAVAVARAISIEDGTFKTRKQAKAEAAKNAAEAALARAESAQAARIGILNFPALASALKVSEGSLGPFFGKWADDHRYFESCYTVSSIPKRYGGTREICAPGGSLRYLQRRILDNLLNPRPLSDTCHGFRSKRSTSSNAAPHVGQAMVINLDLRDFFPTITAARVAGLFAQLDLPGGTMGRAFLVDAVTFRGRLPQGAPTSPGIANLICRRLDSQLSGLARHAGAEYTRYADDLTFSGPVAIASCLPTVRRIVAEEGFALADEKTRLMRRGVRQDVTGLTVNDQVSVPRACAIG